MPFVIVSLDGGGVRGALQCALLGRLLEHSPWLEDSVNMYAGTSVGAYLAAGCATRPFALAKSCCTSENFRSVFGASWEQDAFSADGWYEARYSSAPVEQVCAKLFGESTLGDTKKHLLITAQRIDSRVTLPDGKSLDPLCERLFPAHRWQPVIYHTLDNNNVAQKEKRIAECLLQSSAAPTYFPSRHGCVDGGLLANNPCMIAVSYAKRFGMIRSLEDVVVLSIGTGKDAHNMDMYGPNANLGKMQWVGRASDLAMQANSEAATLECASLLGESNFFRLQPVLDAPVRLDDVNAVPLLEQMAQNLDLSNAFAFLDNMKKKWF